MRKILVEYVDYVFTDKEYMKEYFFELGIDITLLEKNDVEYVEIEMDDVNKKAYSTFKNSMKTPISERIEDDWYAIMDSIFKENRHLESKFKCNGQRFEYFPGSIT